MDGAPPANSGFVTEAIMVGVAFCGSLVRAAQWVDHNGRFVWWRVLVEIPTAVVLAVIAGSVGAYLNLDIKIQFGIAGLFGLIGPAAVVGIAQMRFGGLFNVPKSGPDTGAGKTD